MAHCYSIGVQLKDGAYDICTTHVPGNEGLTADVERAQGMGIQPRAPSKEEVDRAIAFFEEQGRRGHERQGPPYWGR